MATITGLTSVRMLEIEGMSIVHGEIDANGHLILTKFDGTPVDAGYVVGPAGVQGPAGNPGSAGTGSIPGEIKAWPSGTLPVQGTYGKWVWADGGVYAAATYPIAAGHIHANWKTAHGQSDPGAGNFRVPDLRGLTLSGLDQMPGGARANRMTRSVAITIAGKTGEETHIVTVAEMPSHGHNVSDPGHTHSITDPGHQHAYYSDRGSGANPAISSGYTYLGREGPAAVFEATPTGIIIQSRTTGISISGIGGGGAHENVQPTVFVPYIVRLDG